MDLKKVYDAVKAANAKVDEILNQMLVAFEGEDEEAVKKALELRPALDEAKAKADEANQLYASMRDANVDEKSPASKFVPVNGTAQQQAEGAKTKTRAEFEQMTNRERHEFIANGGAVVDEAAE